jgi:hypothetical protein
MILFSNRLTLYLCGSAGLISFTMTASKAFSGINDFHGSWIEFTAYMGNNLLDCFFNGLLVFCLSGVVVLPVLRFIEKKMAALETHKAAQNKPPEQKA